MGRKFSNLNFVHEYCGGGASAVDARRLSIFCISICRKSSAEKVGWLGEREARSRRLSFRVIFMLGNYILPIVLFAVEYPFEAINRFTRAAVASFSKTCATAMLPTVSIEPNSNWFLSGGDFAKWYILFISWVVVEEYRSKRSSRETASCRESSDDSLEYWMAFRKVAYRSPEISIHVSYEFCVKAVNVTMVE